MKKVFTILGSVILALFIVIMGFQLSQINTELNATRADLNAKTIELSDLHTELDQTNIQLGQTKSDLNKTNIKLDQTTSELSTTRDTLSATTTELDQTKTDLTAAKKETSDLNTRLTTVTSDLNTANAQITTLNKSINLYKSTFGEVFSGVAPNDVINDSQPVTFSSPGPFFSTPLRAFHLVENPKAVNPTYAQLLSFLRTDTTDMYRYVLNYYMCGNFAETVHNKAEAAGIRTGLVLIHFTVPPGHAIVAFVTTDRGLIYIDDTGAQFSGPPSMDGIVYNMRIGTQYIDTFLFPSGWYFNVDNKLVTDIEIYW